MHIMPLHGNNSNMFYMYYNIAHMHIYTVIIIDNLALLQYNISLCSVHTPNM